MIPLTENTCVRASDDQVATTLNDEVVLLEFQQGIYYGLDKVSAFIWEQIQSPITLGMVRDAVLARYDVSPERCWQDLLNLMHDMHQKNLIVIEP